MMRYMIFILLLVLSSSFGRAHYTVSWAEEWCVTLDCWEGLDVPEGFVDDLVSPGGGQLRAYLAELPKGEGIQIVKAWEVVVKANLPAVIRQNPGDLEKVSTYLVSTSKTADNLVAELIGNTKTAGGSVRSWLDIVPNGGGAKIGSKGDYVQRESGEVIYRTVSESDYNQLLVSGKMPATKETSTSPLQAFSEDYDGILFKYYVDLGTIDNLLTIGRTDGSGLVAAQFGDMPQAVSGWINEFVRFKKEGTQVNIQLGRGPGIDVFNENLIAFERVVSP